MMTPDQEQEEKFKDLLMRLSPDDRAQIVKALRDQLTPEQHAELEMMRKEGRLLSELTQPPFLEQPPLWALKRQLEIMASHDQGELCMAGGAVRSLGNIVFTYQADCIEGLTKSDVEGIGVAIEVLGRHIEQMSADFECNISNMLEQVEKLEA
jgi:hypothetical protein